MQTLLLMKSPHCRALCCWFCGPRVPGRGASRRDGRACPVCLAGPVLDPGTGRGGHAVPLSRWLTRGPRGSLAAGGCWEDLAEGLTEPFGSFLDSGPSAGTVVCPLD